MILQARNGLRREPGQVQVGRFLIRKKPMIYDQVLRIFFFSELHLRLIDTMPALESPFFLLVNCIGLDKVGHVTK